MIKIDFVFFGRLRRLALAGASAGLLDGVEDLSGGVRDAGAWAEDVGTTGLEEHVVVLWWDDASSEDDNVARKGERKKEVMHCVTRFP